MRFGIVILLTFVFEISPAALYEVVDYRIPLCHPLLTSVADKEAELSMYLKKLNIDYPKDDIQPIMASLKHKLWRDQFHRMRIQLRNKDACELSKTRVNDTTFDYLDTVSDFGKAACFNQCVAENTEFYRWFLAPRLQPFLWRNPLIDVALETPANFSADLELSQCSRMAAKKYRCDCFYRNFRVKVSHDFERLFDKILLEIRQLTQPINREELDKKHGIPMKLVAFLIICHLNPDHMLPYMVWWALSEPDVLPIDTYFPFR